MSFVEAGTTVSAQATTAAMMKDPGVQAAINGEWTFWGFLSIDEKNEREQWSFVFHFYFYVITTCSIFFFLSF